MSDPERGRGQTYAIGDVHGCYESLAALLDRLPFDAGRDRLWLVGDLVNRGPENVAVLRWARDAEQRLGDRFAAVLGNHDLHLLRRAEGLREDRPRDTFGDVLTAGDRERVLVHAGLPPGWSVEEAVRRARTAEASLADPAARRALLADGGDPAVEALPNLRTVAADGRPCDHSGPPETAPPGCIPWFRHPERASRGAEIVCGHWAALGFHREDGVTALDSGCVWGGALTAVRLEDGAVFRQPTLERELPGVR